MFSIEMSEFTGEVCEAWVDGIVSGDDAMKLIINKAAALLGREKPYTYPL